MSLAHAAAAAGPAERSVAATLARIADAEPRLGAFTDVTPARALATARAVDAGAVAGPLAGVPFAVKNLFDVEGLPTRAGSKINRERSPATRDAALVRRLEAAGAVLVGALNMGEYAYDFTGENVHDGPSRNPHDPGHMSGGSSGGSGAAVGAGLVPLALASDTNGSIRVPSALCGVFGLKPTYGRLTRAGTFPFVHSLDHLGPIAASTRHLALAYDAMQGPDPEDAATTTRAPEPVAAALDAGCGDLRIAVLGGHFARGGEPDCFEAVRRVASFLGAGGTVDFPEAARARAAAYVLTATEGAALHLDRLRERPEDFDPAVRDRLIAGATIPAAYVARAQRFRRWFAEAAAKAFETADVVLAPATPCRAPKLGQTTMTLAGETVALRPNLGVFTQPLSFIGLPVVCAPVWLDDGLPLGVQIVAPPWREDAALRVARALEVSGVSAVRPPVM
ncbi:AtzE family amidohydrolase [Hansschlegelia sp. KR7-227]|uniref:AtzE family amidohydrolase n=1 Tax=Hansschlegelia sp. KR7-227 TaxID=3400914 RepID=UPI003C0C75AA